VRPSFKYLASSEVVQIIIFKEDIMAQNLNAATNSNINPVSTLKKDVEQLGKDVKSAADESMNYVKENFSNYYEKGQEMVQQAEQSLEGHIRKHPLRSLLIAAGVGLVVGLIQKKL